MPYGRTVLSSVVASNLQIDMEMEPFEMKFLNDSAVIVIALFQLEHGDES